MTKFWIGSINKLLKLNNLKKQYYKIMSKILNIFVISIFFCKNDILIICIPSLFLLISYDFNKLFIEGFICDYNKLRIFSIILSSN